MEMKSFHIWPIVNGLCVCVAVQVVRKIEMYFNSRVYFQLIIYHIDFSKERYKKTLV